jgi:hypothetical protein
MFFLQKEGMLEGGTFLMSFKLLVLFCSKALFVLFELFLMSFRRAFQLKFYKVYYGKKKFFIEKKRFLLLKKQDNLNFSVQKESQSTNMVDYHPHPVWVSTVQYGWLLSSICC